MSFFYIGVLGEEEEGPVPGDFISVFWIFPDGKMAACTRVLAWGNAKTGTLVDLHLPVESLDEKFS